jgi:hypothetical protein
MIRSILLACLVAGFAAGAASQARAWGYPPHPTDLGGHHHTRADRWSARFAQVTPWHANYAYTQAGRPVALVVPPTANMRSRYSWGVAQNEIGPIHHRFARPYPGPGFAPTGYFAPTPLHPSHTDQFGVYSVRGPWE